MMEDLEKAAESYSKCAADDNKYAFIAGAN